MKANNYHQLLEWLINNRQLENILSEDCECNFSMIGRIKGKDLTKSLQWNKNITYCRNIICNELYLGDSCLCNIETYAGIEENSTFYPLQFGGKLLLKFSNEKICGICYDMDWFKGNTDFQKDWVFPDYSIYGGHSQTIQTELMGKKTDSDDVLSSIKGFFHALDCSDYTWMLGFCSEDIKFDDDENGCYEGKSEMINFYKALGFREYKQHDSFKFQKIEINGNSATVKALRLEPHRIKSKLYSIVTKEQTIYNADVEFRLVYENDQWLISNIKIVSHIWIVQEKNETSFADENEIVEIVLK